MTEVFDNFNDVKDLSLRTFNRVVTLNNMYSDLGRAKAEEYVQQFSDIERKQMYIMQAYIKKEGEENVRKTVTKGLRLV